VVVFGSGDGVTDSLQVYVLLKFFRNETYLNALLDGLVYANSAHLPGNP
jgi:hypothetical protein